MAEKAGRRTARTSVPVVCCLCFACQNGGEMAGDAEPESWGSEGVIIARADAGQEGRSSDAGTTEAGDSGLLPDGAWDARVGDPGGNDLGAAGDAGGPEGTAQDAQSDTAPVTDAGAETLTPQDVPVGPCGACPADKPDCVAGKCVCTGTSCSEAKYCKGGECVPCDNDSHCGKECVSCNELGQYCAPEATGCVDCDAGHPCPPGKQCAAGVCVACAAIGLCGPQCILCPEQQPNCVNDVCVCNAASCWGAALCEAGVCVPCTDYDAAHCGAACAVCGGDAPHCKGGTCMLCNQDASCGQACQPCPALTPKCKPDGSGCVGCLGDGDCQAGWLCNANACIPPCKAQGCAADLSAGGQSCKKAFVVGRLEASKTVKFAHDTSDSGDDDDLNYFFGKTECWDASYDLFYRIYLMPGETLSAVVTPKYEYFDVMLKLYTGTECDLDSAGIFEANDKYLIGCYNSGYDEKPESFSYNASAEGWFTIVVDGRQVGSEYEDWGPFELSVTLKCSEANCCCP